MYGETQRDGRRGVETDTGQDKEEKRDLGMRQLKIAEGVQQAKPTAFVSINFID